MDTRETGALFNNDYADRAPTTAVEAQLTDRRPDGSVVGSYPAKTMENLLHYHNMPEFTAATGAMVMGGELIK